MLPAVPPFFPDVSGRLFRALSRPCLLTVASGPAYLPFAGFWGAAQEGYSGRGPHLLAPYQIRWEAGRPVLVSVFAFAVTRLADSGAGCQAVDCAGASRALR